MSSNSGIRRWYSSTSKRKFLIAQDAFVSIFVLSVVVNGAGKAVFNTSYSLLPFNIGDQVLLQSFSSYADGTYYISPLSSSTFLIYPTQTDAINNTNAVAFAGNDTGTITLQS